MRFKQTCTRLSRRTATGLSLLDLPDDVLLDIAEWLSLINVSMWALSRYRFMEVFKRKCTKWNLPVMAKKKFRFLQHLDTLHEDWILCKNCVKFHRWHPVEKSYNECAPATIFNDERTDLILHHEVTIPATTIQLVKRARYYGDLRYGLPIECLYKRYRTLDGWHIKTEAVFTRDNALLVRVTNESLFAKQYGGLLETTFCGCGVSCTVNPAKDDSDALVEKYMEQLNLTYKPRALIETTRGGERSIGQWHRCQRCFALLNGAIDWLTTDPLNWKNTYVRYYDLGPVSAFNDIPTRHYTYDDALRIFQLDYKRDQRGYAYKDCKPRELHRFAKGDVSVVAPTSTDRLLGRLKQVVGCGRTGAVEDLGFMRVREKHKYIMTWACSDNTAVSM